jgi:hypothetical protein
LVVRNAARIAQLETDLRVNLIAKAAYESQGQAVPAWLNDRIRGIYVELLRLGGRN